MRLLVFSALLSICQCFHALPETNREVYGLPPQFISDKDENLRQVGPNARVSYANPFLQYQNPYFPISYGFPQYEHGIGQYKNVVRPPNVLLPNEIPISNNKNAFVQNAPIFPLFLSQRDGFKGPGIPIIPSDTPINNKPPGIRTIEHPGTYFDLIHQILKGKPTGPTVSTVHKNQPHSSIKQDRNNLNKDYDQKLPIIRWNNGDSRGTQVVPDMRYVINSSYDDIKIQNEAEEVLNYAIGLMLREEYLSPGIIQVINSAKNIDFSKLDEIDETQLIKLSVQDMQYLKRYMIKILSAYGLSAYTFKLLEYIYLIEGTPKNEINLMLKILSEDGVQENLNRTEQEQLKRHLLRINEDYSESPYILAFLKNILETKFIPKDNPNLPILDIDYGGNNVQNEEQEITIFVIRTMISENNISPNIINVLNNAQNIDFSNFDNLRKIRLIQVNEEDIQRLKKYLVQVINLYGLTTYTFRLLEYIFLLEGRPQIETYLMWLVLADNNAVKRFDEDELKLLQEHLIRIYRNYNESPYILAFLKKILDNQFKGAENDKSANIDLNDKNVIHNANKKDIQRIYLYLSQTYDNNPNILKILKNINDIYVYLESDAQLPVIAQNDLQHLATARPEDLNLLVKYILQVISQRGNNIYLNGLLSYINWIQNSDNFTVFNATEERVNLSPIYQYLFELNNSKSKEYILVILNHLTQNKNFRSPVTTLNSIETLGYGDLIRIKEFLLRNEQSELTPAIMDFVNKLKQAIQKQEVKVILKGDQNTVVINPDDLENLKQYMISKQTATPDYYLNEIIQLIKQAKNKKPQNGFGKLKYFDLLQIYKYLLQTQGDDINNPVLIKVQQYVNENNKDVNKHEDSNYKKPHVNIIGPHKIVNGNQINLEKIYNYLLQKSITEKSNILLLELLRYFNQTQALPNGELKVKIISTNSTKPDEYISQNVFDRLLPYLMNLKQNSKAEDSYLYSELLNYLKNKPLGKDYEVVSNELTAIPVDTLYRIKQYLQTFIAQHGENEHVFKIILQINEILKSQHKQYIPQSTNDFNINENDLKTLLQYLTKYVNVPNSKSDILKLVQYIIKSEKDIENRENYEKNQDFLVRLLLIQLTNSNDITPAVKDILHFLIVSKMYEDPNLVIMKLKESHKLDKLNSNEILELIKYLQHIKTTLGANGPIGKLIDNIIKLKKEIEINKNHMATPTNKHVPDNVEKDKDDIKISNENAKIINKYLIDLFNQYGNDEDIAHILYKFNHINKGTKTNTDLLKLIMSSSNKEIIINIDDLRSIIDNVISFIDHHSLNQELMKMLQVILNFGRPSEKNKIISILGANITHVEVAIDQKNMDRIHQYFSTIAMKYKLYPNRLNILPIVYPEQNNLYANERNNTEPHNFYTLAIRYEELRMVTKYVLELIKRYGMLPELIDVLFFVADIYGDDKMAFYLHNKNKTNNLVVSVEKNILLQDGVIQNIQNMTTDGLKNMYMEIIQKVFASHNSWDNGNKNQVIDILLNMYKNEVTPVKKYILLVLLDYLKNNKEIDYEALRQPEYILVLLNLMNKPTTIPPHSEGTTPSNGHEKYLIIQPYDYKNDIEGGLTKLIKTIYQPGDLDDESKQIVSNYTIYEITKGGISEQGKPKIKVIKLTQPISLNEKNKNIVGNDNTTYETSQDRIHTQTQPDSEVKEVNEPIDTNEKSKHVVSDHTISKVSQDGIRKQPNHNIKAINITQPIGMKKKDQSVVANYNNIYENSKDGIHTQTQPDFELKKIIEPVDMNKKSKHVVSNDMIYDISENGIRGQGKPNNKIITKPVSMDEKNKNIVTNNEINVDEIRRQVQPNFEITKINEPNDTNEKSKHIVSKDMIYNISENGINEQGKPYIKVMEITQPVGMNEKNKNIVTNYEINEDEIRRQVQPIVGVKKIVEPVDMNEKSKHIISNDMIYNSSENGKPAVKVIKIIQPVGMNEKSKNIVTNYEINEDEIRRQVQPIVEMKKKVKPVDMNEISPHNVPKYTIYEVTGDGHHGQENPNIKIIKITQPMGMNEKNKNIAANYNTIYDTGKDRIHTKKQHNFKIKKINELNDINEKINHIVSNDKIDKTSENGIREQRKPNIKVIKITQPVGMNEKNNNIAANYNTIYDTSEHEIHTQTQPYFEVKQINEPIDMKENTKNIISNYTIYKVSEDGQGKPKIKIIKMSQPIGIDEINKNIIASNNNNENSYDGNHRRTLNNLKVEKLNEPADANEKDIDVAANHTIFQFSHNGKRKRTQPNRKIVKNIEPVDPNEQNNTIQINYKTYGMNEDQIRRHMQPTIKMEEVYKPNDENEKYKNVNQDGILPNAKVEGIDKPIDTNEFNKNETSHNFQEVSSGAIRGHAQTNIKPTGTNEQNEFIQTNYTIYKIGEDGILGQTQSNIKVEKVYNTIDGNGKNTNTIVNYTVVKIRDRTLPDINVEKKLKPVSTNELSKNISYEIAENSNDKPNIKIETMDGPFDMKKETKNNVTKYTIYGSGENGSHEQTKIKIEKNYSPLDTINMNQNVTQPNIKIYYEKGGDHTPALSNYKVGKIDSNVKIKNTVANNTIYEINKVENSGQTQPNIKETLCEEANMKLDLILSQLKIASNSNQQIDWNMEEFLKIYDVLEKFRKKLSFESLNKVVPSNVLINELEQRILQNNVEQCVHQSNMNVKTILSDLIIMPRQVIQYMKAKEYEDNKMKTIVMSLINSLLPDINSIAVKDCEVQTSKELMNLLSSSVYDDKNLEVDEIQFEPGYTLQGDTHEDFLHTLSMQKLREEIAKYKN